MLVKNWMSKNVVSIDVNDSMQLAIYTLQDNKIKLLPVRSGEKLVGIVSDRDLKKASPSDATTLDMHELLYLISRIKISDLMTKNPITVSPDYTIEEAAQLLLEHKISGLPVLDLKGKLVGIITQSDIFRALIAITGLGKKGIQIGICFKDIPGPIKEVRELIHNYGGRTAGILSSGENAPEGYLHVYFRIYDIDRKILPDLIKELEKIGTLLYVVDHRQNKRTVYETS
ncbi:MAG: CBS and ACT domain-containing protein [Desulfobacterales bacterium]|jgi:acetoin utilization protein AcuB|nr:CBS and ACT domain-containing protein [Desulfobacterales bacterium]